MLRRVAIVRTDVLEELSASFIMVTRIGELGTTLPFLRIVRRLLVRANVVPSSPILVTLMKEAPSSSGTSVLSRATRRNIPEDTILHSHRCENLKSYIPNNWSVICMLRNGGGGHKQQTFFTLLLIAIQFCNFLQPVHDLRHVLFSILVFRTDSYEICDTAAPHYILLLTFVISKWL
jgi:hypothetical protein